MRNGTAALLAVVVAVGGLGTLGAAPAAGADIEITEWVVPWENTRPRDPYVDGQGRVWFVGQRGDYLAYLDPATGDFRRYELDPGTGPHNLIVDEDGFVWYAGNRAMHIGRLDPETGAIEKILMPTPDARDPHTLTFDHNGDIWFSVQGGSFVGKLGTETGSVELVPVEGRGRRPTASWSTRTTAPGSASSAPTGSPPSIRRPWSSRSSSCRGPRPAAPPGAHVERAPVVRRLRGRSARPLRSVHRRGPGMGGPRRRGGPAVRHGGRRRGPLYFVESGVRPNRFVGFDPAAEEFFAMTEIASGGGTVRHMYYHPPTGDIWFGTDTNNIGRARVVP